MSVPPDGVLTPVREIFTPFAKHLVMVVVPCVTVVCSVHAPLGAHAAMIAFERARQGSAAHDGVSAPRSRLALASLGVTAASSRLVPA